MSLQPLEDRIVVRPGEAEETTVSGLVIPDTAKEKPQQGEVLAVGPGRRSDQTGELIPVDVAVGDVVLYSKYGGTEITVDGEDLLVLSSRDVLAKVVAERQEEVALTNHDPGARGGRQRIPRPATARAGAAAPWAGFARVAGRGPITARPGAGPLRRLRRPPRPPLAPGRPGGRGAAARCSRRHGDGAHRAHPAARDHAVAPRRDRVPGRQGRSRRSTATPRDAALREAEEEIGLRRELVDVSPTLPTLGDRGRAVHRSRPSSGITDGRPVVTADSWEVDRVFDVRARRAARRRRVPRGAVVVRRGDGTSGPCSSTSSRTRRSGAPPRAS